MNKIEGLEKYHNILLLSHEPLIKSNDLNLNKEQPINTFLPFLRPQMFEVGFIKEPQTYKS